MRILCDTYKQFKHLEEIFNNTLLKIETRYDETSLFPSFFIQESDGTFNYCVDEGDCKRCDFYQHGSKKLCRSYTEITYKVFMRKYKLERLIKNHQTS